MKSRSLRFWLLALLAGVASGYFLALYYVLFTDLPSGWVNEHGVPKGILLVGGVGAPAMFAMGGWLCVPLTVAAAPAFRAMASRGWVALLALAVLVGAAASVLLGYLPLLQLIWLEDHGPAALAQWKTHRFALDSAFAGWGFLAPPCIALSVTLGALYGVALGAPKPALRGQRDERDRPRPDGLT